ncbi:MAG: (2Fe-2S) ferredoxin domain-containing protein [Candidatus Omnitrophica bacterium]|nr:(2Fe-2S) ferredoxin domain-containing protein [Candidatus Omnitrophota bacterium]
MEKLGKHIFVCASFRANGEPQGVCHKKGSVTLMPYLIEGLSDRGMDDVMVTASGCLKVCDRGPAMVIYPEGDWYGNLDEQALDEILDAIEGGNKAEKYLLT